MSCSAMSMLQHLNQMTHSTSAAFLLMFKANQNGEFLFVQVCHNSVQDDLSCNVWTASNLWHVLLPAHI